MTRPIRAAVLIAAFVLVPFRAHATFHIMSISEVMSGFNGDPNVQYVELRMDQPGQNAVNQTRLTAFNADGSVFTVLYETTSTENVPCTGGFAPNRNILYGTAAFATAAGVTQAFKCTAETLEQLGSPLGRAEPFDDLVPGRVMDSFRQIPAVRERRDGHNTMIVLC